MKLNLLKCAFGVAFGKFLSFMVNHRGIKANLEKIRALIDMRSPSKTKEVHSLTGRVAALSRFISRATDKEYLSKLPLLSKPVEGEPLYLYLVVTKYAISGKSNGRCTTSTND